MFRGNTYPLYCFWYFELTMVSWFDLYALNIEIFKFVLFLLFTPQFPSFAFFGREKHRHERSVKGMFLSICTIRIE